MSISTLVLTLNEEVNLPRCLESLFWCDDIIILDSYSTDNTVKFAQEYGAKIFQRKFDNFANQRNFGLENIEMKHDWVLHLDADEVITENLRNEMFSVINSDKFDAYQIPSKLIFMGKWLRYSGMYPCYQVRLGRKNILRFKEFGHGQRENIETYKIGILREPYLHYNFSKGLDDWFLRHNYYSTLEASKDLTLQSMKHLDWKGLLYFKDKVRHRRALKEASSRLPYRSTLRFLYMYILKRGFLDGWPGFIYCRLLALYEDMITIKIMYLRNINNR